MPVHIGAQIPFLIVTYAAIGKCAWQYFFTSDLETCIICYCEAFLKCLLALVMNLTIDKLIN